MPGLWSTSSALRRRAYQRYPWTAVVTFFAFVLFILVLLNASASDHSSSFSLSPGSTFSSSWSRAMGAKPPSLPDVHLLLPITKDAAVKSPKFCRALLGTMMSGYDPIVYNWDVRLPVMATHKAKVSELANILESKYLDFPEDDLILLVDALDVWIQLPPETMARRFVAYGHDVIVGAERHCIPNAWKSAECQDAPKNPLPDGLWEPHGTHQYKPDHSKLPRHANSGTVVGRAGKMGPLFRKLADIIGDKSYHHKGDQGAFNTLLVSGDLYVDHFHRLFWPSAADESSLIWLNTPVDPDAHITAHYREANYSVSGVASPDPSDPIPWHMLPSIAHHQLTGQIPVALHFNAIATKNLLDDLWGMPWYSTKRFRQYVKERMAGATVKSIKGDGTWHEINVEQVCHNHLPGVWDDRE